MPIRHATLRQLRVFEAAARLRSFSRAAEELHLTQPGISMQIRELEQSAGLPLFDRIGRTMHITEAGTELLRRTHEILQALQGAQDTFDALQGLRGGRLKLGVTSTAKYFAPRLLARFRALHPALEFQLAVHNREDVIAMIAGNEIDLAIMGRPPQELETVAAVFAQHPLVIIAPPDHPLVNRRRLPMSALAAEHFLVREPGSGTRTAMEEFMAAHATTFRVSMEMSSNETIKQAVMAGMGLSFLSRHTIGLELASQCLAVLDVRGLPVKRNWFVVHLAAKRLSPTAEAFRAYVQKHGGAVLRAM